ncbi:MAG: 30S ribosomal protein S8 [Alphaproteobacteria bacterium]|nr:30S ribosomal protein S8 [Alphaproteobacteria bacterium]
MSMNYRLADMLAQIKNGQSARLAKVTVLYTQFLADVCAVLAEEGYIEGAERVEVGKNKYNLEITLKYFEGDRVIKSVECVSKPGRRVYSEIGKLPKHSNGLGISILSTSKGVMSDFGARQANVGGEVLCTVF